MMGVRIRRPFRASAKVFRRNPRVRSPRRSQSRRAALFGFVRTGITIALPPRHERWRYQLPGLGPVAERLGIAVAHHLEHGSPGVGGVGKRPGSSGHELVGRREQRAAVIDDVIDHGRNVRVGDAQMPWPALKPRHPLLRRPGPAGRRVDELEQLDSHRVPGEQVRLPSAAKTAAEN